MNEVATQTVALVRDSLEQRGLDSETIWAGLGIDDALMRRRGGRIDWDTWVAMLARIEQHSPIPLEDLLAPGVGIRNGHPFTLLASGLISLRDLYGFFARWGMKRSFTITRSSFEALDGSRARFSVSIDAQRAGSLPMLRVMTGVLRHMPRLQGYASAMVRMVDGATPHHAEYTIELPTDRPFVARARRVVRVFAGATAALDELEAQANEIAAKNLEVEKQLAESRERDQILDVALAAGHIGLWRSKLRARPRSTPPSGAGSFIPRTRPRSPRSLRPHSNTARRSIRSIGSSRPTARSAGSASRVASRPSPMAAPTRMAAPSTSPTAS